MYDIFVDTWRQRVKFFHQIQINFLTAAKLNELAHSVLGLFSFRFNVKLGTDACKSL